MWLWKLLLQAFSLGQARREGTTRKEKQLVATSAASLKSSPPKTGVVWLNEQLEIVEESDAAYLLTLSGAQWSEMKGEWRTLKPDVLHPTAPFRADFSSIAPKSYESKVVGWQVVVPFIKHLLQQEDSECAFAFRWVNTPWPRKYELYVRLERGTLKELESVLCLAAHLWVEPQRWQGDVAWKVWLYSNTRAWADEGDVRGVYELEVDYDPLVLTEAQCRLLGVVHHHFRVHCKDEMVRKHIRLEWMWRSADGNWSFEVPEPSSHERLEARLRLREWLEGKIAPDEIQALLDETKEC